jgi:hypothetical protein
MCRVKLWSFEFDEKNNRMSIQEIPPQKLILRSWWNCYEENLKVIWRQLERLNSSIFVLGKILAFRFDLFTPFDQNFWILVEGALFETCVMTIWRIGVDTRSEGLTLRQFKNCIAQNLTSKAYKIEFEKLVKEIRFEKTVSRIEPAIKEIRHNYIAHFNLDKHLSPTPTEIKERTILFSELKKFRDALNEMFELFCFGCVYGVLPIDYQCPPKGKKTDIEQLLDNVVKESGLLNLPEKDPMIWPMLREKWKKENVIEIVNGYRIKFGLPEA